MNKIAPDLDREDTRKKRKKKTKSLPPESASGSGKEDEPEAEPVVEKSPQEQADEVEEEEKQELLGRARKRFDKATQAEAANRRDALEDLKFFAGEQWPADVVAQRNFDKRPCLTINKIPTFAHQITNDLRQNRPSINVSPVGDHSDREVAKMLRGLIREIERASAADLAYDTAAFNAVVNGLGYWRTITEYEDTLTFDQVIRVKRITNPFTVYLDPDHQEPDGSDAKWAFVTEMIPRHEFEEKYPNADPIAWAQGAVGEGLKNWVTQDQIRVAEYFEIGHESRTLVQLSNGHIGWEDELADSVLGHIDSGTLQIFNKRQSEEQKVTWYTLTVKEILEKQPWLGKWIPIVKIIGDEVNIEGKTKLSGVVRNAKDAQRMVNFWETAFTELVALAPKAPFVGAEGQFEGHEAQWKQANTRSFPYLQYKPETLGGKPLPPPQRQPLVQVPQGIQQGIQNASQNMMATTGIRFDATMQERMIDESGRAIRELRRSGDIGSFHYVDNFARSLRHQGAIFIDLIPKIYDTKRIATILREDDEEETVQLDPNAEKPFQQSRNPQSGKVLKIFNPAYGKYGVTVTIGPSFATKRIESSESMMSFAKAVPQIAQFVPDLIAESMDWPGAEKFATRLAKVVAMQSPGLIQPDMQDVSPEIQALLMSMQEQLKKMTEERAVLMKTLADQDKDRQVKLEGINKVFEAKMAALDEKLTEAMVKAGAQQEGDMRKMANESAKAFMEHIREAVKMAVEARQDEIAREHELKLAAAQPQPQQ